MPFNLYDGLPDASWQTTWTPNVRYTGAAFLTAIPIGFFRETLSSVEFFVSFTGTYNIAAVGTIFHDLPVLNSTDNVGFASATGINVPSLGYGIYTVNTVTYNVYDGTVTNAGAAGPPSWNDVLGNVGFKAYGVYKKMAPS